MHDFYWMTWYYAESLDVSQVTWGYSYTFLAELNINNVKNKQGQLRSCIYRKNFNVNLKLPSGIKNILLAQDKLHFQVSFSIQYPNTHNDYPLFS